MPSHTPSLDYLASSAPPPYANLPVPTLSQLFDSDHSPQSPIPHESPGEDEEDDYDEDSGQDEGDEFSGEEDGEDDEMDETYLPPQASQIGTSLFVIISSSNLFYRPNSSSRRPNSGK
jgi:hypothetical protein